MPARGRTLRFSSGDFRAPGSGADFCPLEYSSPVRTRRRDPGMRAVRTELRCRLSRRTGPTECELMRESLTQIQGKTVLARAMGAVRVRQTARRSPAADACTAIRGGGVVGAR